MATATICQINLTGGEIRPLVGGDGTVLQGSVADSEVGVTLPDIIVHELITALTSRPADQFATIGREYSTHLSKEAVILAIKQKFKLDKQTTPDQGGKINWGEYRLLIKILELLRIHNPDAEQELSAALRERIGTGPLRPPADADIEQAKTVLES